jgi:hypothetical protein
MRAMGSLHLRHLLLATPVLGVFFLMSGCGQESGSREMSDETNQQSEDRTKGMMDAMKNGAYSKPAAAPKGAAK